MQSPARTGALRAACCAFARPFRFGRRCALAWGLLAPALLGWPSPARASLSAYDAVIASDAAAGLTPLARLTNAVILTGSNRAAFNFGTNSGDVTMEFILHGDPTAGGASSYLAVGTNTSSNLRYEQWNNTGQLGFTQLTVADYLFSPVVPSPTQPVHIAYVWQAALRTMKLYWNGSLAGTRSGVSASFAMPAGQGWLGANPGGTETMVGTIQRVTVYAGLLSDAALQRHSDAYNGVVRPPILISFEANPNPIFTPDPALLTWDVRDALGVFINGLDVTGATNLPVAPASTTTYTLLATNAGGSVTGQVKLVVNPAPILHSFAANPRFSRAGETVALTWNVSHGQTFSIAPGVGDVTAQTLEGMGHLEVQPAVTTTYTLSAGNAFGISTATLKVTIVQPAGHPVISEFMADNQSTLPDEDGDFPDWIELFNPTAAPVNLSGWFLTDDKSQPTKWAFPNITLAAGGYRIVFASGKNRTNPAAPLHTNFQLDRTGEYLALVGPGPSVRHAFDPAFPPQGADISYGLLGGDLELVRYLGLPTPGSANNDIPPPPSPVRFSHVAGLFTNTFQLTLTSDTPGTTIRYTLNGSVPSATNGLLYAGPMAIQGTVRVRAVALGFGQVSRVAGASFIKLAPELAGYTSSLPILVIENFGAGVIPQKGWSGNGSGIKQVPRQAAVWATFEREGGVSALNRPPQMFQTIGIRGRGAFSSTWRQKPYSVEAVDETGAELEVSPLGLPGHADWVLYFPDPDNNKDPALLFNTFAYELSARSGQKAVRFRWVEAFINEDGGDLQLADRRGVYAIIEKVSRGRDRLDFQRLSADGTQGGWLLNINRMDPEPETGWPAPNGATQPWFFHTAGQNRIQQTPPNAIGVGDDEPMQSNGFLNFDNPNGYIINTNQRAAIEGWFRQFEDVLWNNALWRDPLNGYRKYIDEREFADYFVLHNLTRNGDGLLISLFPWKGDDGKLRIGPAWDYNWNAYYISGSPTTTLWHRTDRLWYKRLFADIDFYQLYLDRWWDHRRGAMSDAGLDAIIDGQMAEISPAKAVLNGLPSAADWTNRLAQMKTWLKDRANWIDSNFLRPPVFNQPGGAVPDGFQVTILGTNGVLYYTTDGSDPRAAGGGIAQGAQTYQLPFTLTAQTLVQARLKNGTNWSGLTAAVFYPPQDLSRLVVTEVMYHPPASGGAGSDDLEFLELKNIGPTTLHLGTLTFTTGITFTFTNGTRLAPGQFFVLARNAAAFQNRYPGVTFHGLYTGRLDNGGETIRLSSPLGGTILSVTYNDRAPWPIAPDGHGFSLVPKNASANPNSDRGAHWRASSAPGGSPGADDPEPGPGLAPVLINEVFSRSEPPEQDWIELFNPNAAPVDLGGWFLSDDGAAPKKFRIPPGTILPGGGHLVFSEADFNAVPGSVYSFALNALGDSVYLSSGDTATNLTGYSHGFSFGAAAQGTSFGRHVNSVGEEHFPAQLSPTPGAPNAGPRIGPVVIQEILYHPAAGDDEFIELRNLTDSAVPLFDPAHPTNTWRVNGLGFTFPTDLVLPPQGLLVIAGSDPAAFRAKYSVPAAVPVLGPFAGVLQNSGERLELQRLDAPGPGGVPRVTVDEVRYNDKAPWPPAADGSGPSLQRRPASAYGNDPLHWEAALPTPGADFVPETEPPVITAQPADLGLLTGQDGQFRLEAAGSPPLFFQWLFNNNLLLGETNAILRLGNVQPWQAGQYRAMVFNSAGSAASAVARLTVNLRPTLLSQPTNQWVRPGSNVVFAVSAVGNGPLRYQWRRNGVDLPHATNAILTLTNVQWADAGTYLAVVTDTVGFILTDPVVLDLLINPVITLQPVSRTVAVGETALFSVSITGHPPPFSFRWRRGGITVTNQLQTGLTSVLELPNVQGTNAGTYSVVITNAAFFSPGVLSGSAYLSVVRPPASQVVVPGTGVTLRLTVVSNTAPSLRCQWQFNGTDLPGATNTTLLLTNVQAAQAGTYTVVVINTGGLPAPFSASLEVLPLLRQPRLDPDGIFQMFLEGIPDRTHQIEVSSNLVDWIILTTLDYVSGLVPVTDPAASSAAQRFYRARLAPP